MKPFVITACIAISILMIAPPSTADPHREATQPTAWWWYYNQTGANVGEVADQYQARVIDIEIVDTDPLRFAAAYVHNSGVYATGWWWYYNMTPEDIEVQLVRNEARLIDIERYDTEAGPRYAVVMVPNSGANSIAWWWYVGGDGAFVSSVLDDHQARLVDLEAYEDGGTKYAVIMVDNTGDDQTAWWWYYNVTAATLQNNMLENGSRILEYQVRDPEAGTFDAMLSPNSGPDSIRWWWYYHLTEDDLNALLAQNGARITDIDSYIHGLSRYFSVVMVNNSNDLTTKMGGLLDYGADGSTGVYLKEVQGPVLASLQPDFVYEPASSLKVTHHLYTMRQVMFGYDDLAEELLVAEGLDDSCPLGIGPYNIQTLEETLAGMMQLSDNTDTYAIEERYSRTVINDMSTNVVGMVNTSINHRLGCPWDPLNEMTLWDSALLYEQVATGILLDDATREDFYRLMQNEDTPDPWWLTVDMENLINEVATDLGHPEAAADFWNNTRLAWKPGGDNLSGDHYYRAVSGWLSLPWCDGTPGNREYAFGLFIHDANDRSYCDDRFFNNTIELFRDEVTAGLQSCLSPVSDESEFASAPMLLGAQPNPFNPYTVVSFRLDGSQLVQLEVFDLTGRQVAVLKEGVMAGGFHEIGWNGRDDSGRDLASGVYMVRLKAAGDLETRKVMLIR